MAYDKSTGVLTIDNANETFDVILDNVATALSDYRTTEVAGVFARDVGLLCTSPNVNRNSIRRPIYTPIDKLGMETEAYLQSQMYGFKDLFNNSKNYNKLGSGTTLSWFNTIAAKGEGVDLWGDNPPTTANGSYFVLNQFNQYYAKATNRLNGYIDTVKPLIEKAWPEESTSNTAQYGTNYYLEGIAIYNEEYWSPNWLYCQYIMELTFEEGANIVFEGDVIINEYPETGNSKSGDIRYFSVVNPPEGETYYDSYGNKIEYYESGKIRITMQINWQSVSGDSFSTISDSVHISSQQSTIYGSGIPIYIARTGQISYYGSNTSTTDTNKIGLYFSSVPKYFSLGAYGIDAIGSYKSPKDYILDTVDNGVATIYGTGSNLMAILKFQVGTYAARYFIVNPYYSGWNGTVLYENLGLSESERSNLSYMDCLLFYGNLPTSITDKGYSDNLNDLDSYMLIPERYGYSRVMVSG